MNRLAVGAVVLAATGPGLLFAPVFGLPALLLPVGLVAVTTFGVAQLCHNRLESWRAVLALVVGLLALIETSLFSTTAGGLPTGETLRMLLAGITDSWQLTLQSTWPARPDPELMLFVQLATLVAAVFAVELVLRTRRPLVALLPGLAVLGLSQAYVALTGVTAMVVAFGFAALAGMVLLSADSARRMAVLALIVPAVVGGTALMSTVDPADRPAFSLRDEQHAPLPQERVASPLDEIADRMRHPDEAVFRYTTSDPVDRWRLVVLDTFNGATWTPSGQYRRLGSELKAAPSVTESTDRRNATVRLEERGRWLPSQAMPAAVTGAAPLVDEDAGTLVVPPVPAPGSYDLSWWEPAIDPQRLSGAAIDPTARRGFGDLGEIPDGINELATAAVGSARPSFQTALVLERFLSQNYRLASGAELPTGNGWPALRTFLLETKRGTSEQFATAYVVLARIVGIPARVAVGFRAGGAGTDVVVRNKDVLAWPEVAVAGIGWVPLDPSGTAAASGSSSGSLANTTAQARAQLPPPEEVKDPELPPGSRVSAAGDSDDGFIFPLVPLGSGVVVAIIAWLGGVPLVRAIRRRRRRRRPGARAVVGAWHEARDRVRAYGVPVKPGMTVLDLAGVVPDPPVVAGLHALAHNVDLALWSPAGCTQYTVDEAWAAVHMVRRGFARRPFLARLRAAFSARSLLPLR